MDADFNGKIVVVTGGSHGIGRAIAVAFAARGVQTVLAALAAFLCSAQARHIQGTATAIDGGATPGFY